ncbi:MAG: DUF362 domain-containing protein [Candidatus Thermoplasmatota archaeon]|nr:DUF362 domain-containing protein [Candidatus Thermoplasmatota archaeon]
MDTYPHHSKKHHILQYIKKHKLWFHITGVACIIWFLFRVLPAPHRARYPCQQMSITIATSYITFWSLLFLGLGVWLKKMQMKTTALTPNILMIILLLLTITSPVFATTTYLTTTTERWDPIPKEPIGTPNGYNPGRVTWGWNANATEEQLTGYWWEDHNNNQTIIDHMLSTGIQRLAGTNDIYQAWGHLFTYFNQEHGHGTVGYQTGEKIAIKINLNNCGSYTSQDNDRDASPHVIKALLRQLINILHVNQDDITIYDASRPMENWFYNRVYYETYPADPLIPEFPNVHYVDNSGGATGREQVIASSVRVYFAAGSCAYRTLPTCVADADYLINMPLLKRHPINTGVTLSGKNFFGTWMESVSAIHDYHISGLTVGNPTPQTELFAHEHIGGKTVIYIGDGLYATPNDHQIIGKFNMYPFNNDWTNSLFLSQDPVALDSVMYDFLHTEGTNPIEGSQNYLHQSADPIPNFYDPENDGIYLSESLGVHEHWDTNENIFLPVRYSGPTNNGIDYITYKEEALTAEANGPYEGDIGQNIQFYGNVTGGTPPYTWYWNFGNSNYSTQQNPLYGYTQADEYTITLTVTDDHGLQGTDITSATIHGPQLHINPIKSSLFKIATSITNEGADAYGINWKITLIGGAFTGTITEGLNLTIPTHETITITSKTILGFGPTQVTIETWIENTPSTLRQQKGFVFLFFIYITPGGG